MLRKSTASSLLASLALLVISGRAQCPTNCDAINGDWGTPSDPFYGGVDPNDYSFLEIPVAFCPCRDGEVLNLALTATQTDGEVFTATSSVAWPGASQYLEVGFPFFLQANQIQSGSQVTQAFYVSGSESGAFPPQIFIYTPVTSIFYATSTETVTSTSSSTVTVATTTETDTATTQIAQSTHKTRCSTDTQTITAPTSTKTHVTTVTRKEVTETHPRVIIVTTHAKCVSQTELERKRIAARSYNPSSSKANYGNVEIPWFSQLQGSPVSTTYTYALSVVTTTTTQAIPTTETDTVTSTSTQTPNPPTTTICGRAGHTTTVHPTVTVTSTHKHKARTTTVTSTVLYTSTIYPTNPPPPCPTGDARQLKFTPADKHLPLGGSVKQMH